MTRLFALFSVLVMTPALASAYGGNYGNSHCTPRDIRAGHCTKGGHKEPPPVAQGSGTLGPQEGVPGAPAAAPAKGQATPMGGNNALPGGGIPGGMDPAAAQAAMSALKNSPPGPDGKCANGATPVPGLNGTSSCINMGALGH